MSHYSHNANRRRSDRIGSASCPVLKSHYQQEYSSVRDPVPTPASIKEVDSAPTWPECYPTSDPYQLPDPSSLPNTADADAETESDAESECPETESESFPKLVAKSTGESLAKLLFARYFRKSVGGDGAMVGDRGCEWLMR